MFTLLLRFKHNLNKGDEMNEERFLQKCQQWVFDKYTTQVAAAEALDIHPQYLNTILKGNNNPTPKMLDAMGWEMEVKKTRVYTRRPK